MREVIYGYGNAGLSFKNSEVIKVYTPKDYGYDNFVQNRQRSIQNNAFGSGNKNGKIIVEVNDGKEVSFGVDNVLVYAKGTIDNYKINKIVKINLDNETDIELVRSEIYERAGNWTQASDFYADLYGEELVGEYTAKTFQNYQEIKAEWRRQRSRSESGRSDEVNQGKSDGRRAFGEARQDERYSLNVETAEEPVYMTDEEWEVTLEKEHEDDGRVAQFHRVTQEKEKLTKKERIQKVKETVADAWLRG